MTVNYNEQTLDWKRKTATDPLVLIFKEMISPHLKKKKKHKTTYEIKKKLNSRKNYIFNRWQKKTVWSKIGHFWEKKNDLSKGVKECKHV